MCPWSFSSNYPTDPFLYNFENVYFERKERAVFVHVSLNANELLLPAPFSRIGLCLYSSYLKYSVKKNLFGFEVLFYVLLRLNG